MMKLFPNKGDNEKFKYCGKCKICEYLKQSQLYEIEKHKWYNTLNKFKEQFNTELKMEKDEYFFMCFSHRDNSNLTWRSGQTDTNRYCQHNNLLSNYGKLVSVQFSNYCTCDKIVITLMNSYNMITQKTLSNINRFHTVIYFPPRRTCPESISLFPNRCDDYGNLFNYEFLNYILTDVENKANLSELYDIENRKDDLNRMMKDLQTKEHQYVKLKYEVDSKIEDLKNEKELLNKNNNKYKDKLKILLSRENKINFKEKLKDLYQDLKDNAISLYNCIEIIELPNDIFERRISQIIESLNNMMKTNHILVAESIDENIIMAELLNE